MRKALLLIAAACLGGIAAAGAITAMTVTDVPEMTAAVSTTDAMRACLRLGDGGVAGVARQDPEAVECLRKAIARSVETDTFSEVIALKDEVGRSSVLTACHSAGHLAGVDIVATTPMHVALEKMFHGKPTENDPACGIAVVHGLVQGLVEGEPPYDLPYLAEQCVALEAIHPSYSNECGHYYGHAVWRTHEALSAELAADCARLAPAVKADAQVACMGGAVMQKYDLQAADYATSGPSVQELKPPTYDEAAALCDAIPKSDRASYDGCWGGIGWLFAMRAMGDVGKMEHQSERGRAKIVDFYADLYSRCATPACTATLLNHFRQDDYFNGVAGQICFRPDAIGPLPTDVFTHVCATIVEARTGTRPTPEQPAASAQPEAARSRV